jgi:hypothetical protein
MPNKYEREIEEILRNMERTEPHQGLGNRIRAFNRPRETPRRDRPPIAALSRGELFLLIGIALALVAAGLAYYKSGNFFVGPVYVPAVIALAAFASVVVGLAIGWRDRFRGITSSKTQQWRGTVVDITPRRGPFNAIVTRFRILRLKFRYLRKRDTQ